MNAMLMELRTVLTLQAPTAADLMSPNPVSIRQTAPLREALALLTDKGFTAAPVIDKAGRPVGVISRTDLLVHQRESVHRAVACERETIPEGFQVEEVDGTQVRDVMTPVVFSVAPDTPAAAVVEQLLGLHVHRLFVVDETGVLTGVISAVDVLRHLKD
jgi:CBS-domain-containing membrane protein